MSRQRKTKKKTHKKKQTGGGWFDNIRNYFSGPPEPPQAPAKSNVDDQLEPEQAQPRTQSKKRPRSVSPGARSVRRSPRNLSQKVTHSVSRKVLSSSSAPEPASASVQDEVQKIAACSYLPNIDEENEENGWYRYVIDANDAGEIITDNYSYLGKWGTWQWYGKKWTKGKLYNQWWGLPDADFDLHKYILYFISNIKPIDKHVWNEREKKCEVEWKNLNNILNARYIEKDGKYVTNINLVDIEKNIDTVYPKLTPDLQIMCIAIGLKDFPTEAPLDSLIQIIASMNQYDEYTTTPNLRKLFGICAQTESERAGYLIRDDTHFYRDDPQDGSFINISNTYKFKSPFGDLNVTPFGDIFSNISPTYIYKVLYPMNNIPICYGTYLIPWGLTNHYPKINGLDLYPILEKRYSNYRIDINPGDNYSDDGNKISRIEMEHITYFLQMARYCGVPSNPWIERAVPYLSERQINYITDTISKLTYDISIGLFNQLKWRRELFIITIKYNQSNNTIVPEVELNTKLITDIIEQIYLGKYNRNPKISEEDFRNMDNWFSAEHVNVTDNLLDNSRLDNLMYINYENGKIESVREFQKKTNSDKTIYVDGLVEQITTQLTFRAKTLQQTLINFPGGYISLHIACMNIITDMVIIIHNNPSPTFLTNINRQYKAYTNLIQKAGNKNMKGGGKNEKEVFDFYEENIEGFNQEIKGYEYTIELMLSSITPSDFENISSSVESLTTEQEDLTPEPEPEITPQNTLEDDKPDDEPSEPYESYKKGGKKKTKKKRKKKRKTLKIKRKDLKTKR